MFTIRKILWLILGIICLSYGVSICMLRSGSKFFLVWIAMGAGFFCLSFPAAQNVWEKLPGSLRVVLSGVALCAVALLVVLEALVLRGFGQRGEKNLDAIIVLGAQVWPSGPSLSLKYRLDTAAVYLQENPGTVCIVSGGQGYNEPFTEAQGMYDYLTARGIAPERIRREENSTNTVENIRFSRQLLQPDETKIGIVTNDFHVYRSVAIAGKCGLPDAVGIAAPSGRYYLPNNMFREAFGIIKDRLAGHL